VLSGTQPRFDPMSRHKGVEERYSEDKEREREKKVKTTTLTVSNAILEREEETKEKKDNHFVHYNIRLHTHYTPFQL